MPRPAFTWFPYRALALAVPVIGVLAWSVIVWKLSGDGSGPVLQDAFHVKFMILGAGNGYTLGLATGDLRRTIVGTVGGALLALLTTPLLGLPFAGFLFACTMLAFLIVAMKNGSVSLSLGLCGAVFMLAVCYWAGLISFDSHSRVVIPMAFGTTFICSGIGIVAARPWTMANAMQSWITSSAAAVLGIVCTLPFCVLMAVLDIRGIVATLVCFGCILILANFFYMRLIFSSIERMEPVASTAPNISDTADGTTR